MGTPFLSPQVSRLVGVLAKAAACPADSTKKRNTSDSFFRYFQGEAGGPGLPWAAVLRAVALGDIVGGPFVLNGTASVAPSWAGLDALDTCACCCVLPAVPGAPLECMDSTYCQQHEECYASLLGTRLLGYESAAVAEAVALGHPETVDAIVEFWGPGLQLCAWHVGEPAAQNGRQQQQQAQGPALEQPAAQQQQLGQLAVQGGGQHAYAYSLRLNHTGVPFTRMLFNQFDVAPGKQYRQYWWFLNLQTLLDQAILSLAAAGGRAGGVGGAGGLKRQAVDCSDT